MWKIKCRFGKSKRNGLIEESKNPGPGYYEQKNVLINPPKYTFGLKLENYLDSAKPSITPGPANYTPNFDKNLRASSAYSIAQRPKTSKENLKQPGPGDYDVRGNSEKPSYK